MLSDFELFLLLFIIICIINKGDPTKSCDYKFKISIVTKLLQEGFVSEAHSNTRGLTRLYFMMFYIIILVRVMKKEFIAILERITIIRMIVRFIISSLIHSL